MMSNFMSTLATARNWLSRKLFVEVFAMAMLFSPPGIIRAADGERSAGPHGLFSYVTHYSEDGVLYRQPVVTSPDQMTVLHPTNEIFDGIELIIYWSTVNPEDGKYDFAALDNALDYWSAKGKKVGLSIATVGFPILMSKKFGGNIQTATPDWVMRQVAHYDSQTFVFDHKANGKGHYEFPLYWDPRFVGATSRFISELGRRYETNPKVSFVRIGTGFYGEDAPAAEGGVKPKVPDYSAARWFNYTRQVVSAYEAAFPRKPLEYDLAWTCWIAALGGINDKTMARQFIDELVRGGIVIGHNGFRSESEKLEANLGHGHGQCLQFLERYSQAGYPVVAEMAGPPWVKEMIDTAPLLRVLEKVRPIRINFFGTAVAVANQGNGSQNEKTNAASWQMYQRGIRGQGLNPEDEAHKQQVFVESLRKLIP